MISMERGKYYLGGTVQGLQVPKREYVARTPKEVRRAPQRSVSSCEQMAADPSQGVGVCICEAMRFFHLSRRSAGP